LRSTWPRRVRGRDSSTCSSQAAQSNRACGLTSSNLWRRAPKTARRGRSVGTADAVRGRSRYAHQAEPKQQKCAVFFFGSHLGNSASAANAAVADGRRASFRAVRDPRRSNAALVNSQLIINVIILSLSPVLVCCCLYLACWLLEHVLSDCLCSPRSRGGSVQPGNFFVCFVHCVSGV
jgi:hypothetical protein